MNRTSMQSESISSPKNINHIIHPDPILAAENLSISIVQRFFSKVNKLPTCWEWTGELTPGGPIITRGPGKKIIMARRLSWLIHYGQAPDSRIRTTCGNSACVAPLHLKLKEGMEVPPIDNARAAALVAIDPEQDPDLPPGFSRTFRARFWSKVMKTDSCWLWTGAKHKDGYGWIGKGCNQPGNIIRAHQASWILHNGPVPDGMSVLHNCPNGDKPSCVNPEHLWLGTQKQNMQDAADKYQEEHGFHWTARITPEQVSEIRRLHATGKYMQRELAVMFGVGPDHISRIISNSRW